MASTNPNTLTVCRASAGTGKTYTLAATYVALLLSGQSYRSILAVTFTNKATQEMKDRILLFLDNIANATGADADAALQTIRGKMIAHQNDPDEVLRLRARECYNKMLEDYDNIHISTIDTFLMQLLNGLGQMLDDASAAAAVELDLDHLIATAVDNFLTRPLSAENQVIKRLASYVNERLDEGKDWNIRASLISIAKRLYTESVQQMEAEDRIVFDAEAILRYKANVDWRHAACIKELREAYEPWRNWTTAVDGISGANYVDVFISEIATYLNETCNAENMFRGFTDGTRNKLVNEEGKSLIAKYKTNTVRAREVWQALVHLDELCRACRRVYVTHKYTIALLNDLAWMTAIRGEIQALLVENNSVLLAQTANKLHAAMKDGDADFILEKAGIRYRHIMLDEFQDTSVLQWQNFKPLVEEILANGGTVFIVGDIKQSIYRWRNGDWEIMAGLNEQTPNIGAFFHSMPLRKNFRSSREVVQFNLSLFQKLTSEGYGNEFAATQYDEQFRPEALTDYYSGHEGGFVKVTLVPCGKSREIRDVNAAQDTIALDMFGEIVQRLQMGESASDMLILVRNHSEAEKIVELYRKLSAEVPELASTQLVSCDSFHLDSSRSVQFLIQSLRWLVLQDEVSKSYISLLFPEVEFDAINNLNKEIPLSELLEELAKLIPSQQATDLAFINALFDGVHNYVGKYGSDAKAFLTYWGDNLHEQSIAAPTAEAIQIMTIHAAKGLEAKNVFIPFCSWEMEKDRPDDVMWCDAKALLKAPVQPLKRVPIRMSSALANSEYETEYQTEHLQQRFDNLNVLYVALTRARENLYVYGELPDTQVGSKKHVSALLYTALRDKWEELDYSLVAVFGDPNEIPQPSATKSGKMIDRFAFDKAAVEQAQLHIGERPVSFRMSRESMDSLRFGADEESRTSRIDLGNVCHAIMEQVETQSDSDAAIQDAKMRGLIADEQTEKDINRLINVAWTNTRMIDWFSGRWELLREATFLTANAELRPDRVMIDRKTSTAIVLDYKFGNRDSQYAQQVRDYMRIMAQLQFRHVEGYLWYAQEALLQPVKL